MKVTVQAHVEIPRPRPVVFDYATSEDRYPEFLLPVGPVAGIAKGTMVDGAELAKGAHRIIETTDGAVIDETILEYDRPNRYRYGWTGGLKRPFSLLVRAGEGCWVFSDVAAGTRIDWTYRFELTSPLAYPLALPALKLFQRWQRTGLERAREQLTAA